MPLDEATRDEKIAQLIASVDKDEDGTSILSVIGFLWSAQRFCVSDYVICTFWKSTHPYDSLLFG